MFSCSFQQNRYMRSERGYKSISLICALFVEVLRGFVLAGFVAVAVMVC